MNSNSELVSLVKRTTLDLMGFNCLIAICLYYGLTDKYIQFDLFGKQYNFSARCMNGLFFPVTVGVWGLLCKRYL